MPESHKSGVKLKNFFVVCQCGEELRFDYIDQVRTCECGRTLQIAESVKHYLLTTYTNHIDENDKTGTTLGGEH